MEEEAPITLMTLVDPSGDGRNAIEAVCYVLQEKINQAQERIATESLRGAANQALISALSFMVTEYQTLQDELHTIEYVSRVETSGYARVSTEPLSLWAALPRLPASSRLRTMKSTSGGLGPAVMDHVQVGLPGFGISGGPLSVERKQQLGL